MLFILTISFKFQQGFILFICNEFNLTFYVFIVSPEKPKISSTPHTSESHFTSAYFFIFIFCFFFILLIDLLLDVS